MSKLTQEQIKEYAEVKELWIDLPVKFMTEKQLRKRYHLELGDVNEDSGDKDALFYNIDLRSHCGFLGEEWGQDCDIILFPKYYAQGWEQTYFKRLLEDATEIKIVKEIES